MAIAQKHNAAPTGDQKFVKSVNRAALLRTIRGQPGVSRADLSEICGLTKSTVGLLTKELIDEGWLFEKNAHTTGALGRWPTPLFLEGRRLAIIGAELGIDALRVVVTTVTGDILATKVESPASENPEKVCAQLAKIILQSIKEVDKLGRTLLGIGVGLPGLVAHGGVLRFAPNLGWHEIQVASILGKSLTKAGYADVPLYIQNEADVAAIGEYEFAQQTASEPLVYLSCGAGVGAGILLNDRIITGLHGTAGEVGHTTLAIDGPLCSCGKQGCAEAFIGLAAIGRSIGSTKARSITTQEIRDRLLHKNASAIAAVEDAARYLGGLMQNVWSTFDPACIVLGGDTVAEFEGVFYKKALETFNQYVKLNSSMVAPEVRLSKFGRQAIAAGAAALVLHIELRPMLPLKQQMEKSSD